MRFIWLRKDRNLSKEKIQFFINTAHDIRTPLTLIKAPLSDISRNEELSEQGRANLQLAIRSTDKLSDLATKLIDFQKEELYTSDINVICCDVNSYVEGFLEQFKPYAEKKNIELTFEGSNDELEAWIDRNKLDSIIHNLVSNALKYTPEGGKIKVRVSHNKSHWFLKISDTGIGISAEDQKKMFKRLFRGDNAVNLQITGTGIGMLQTYKLVKRHKGKISVTSKENEGSIFRLRFPINDRRYKPHVEHHDEGGQELVYDVRQIYNKMLTFKALGYPALIETIPQSVPMVQITNTNENKVDINISFSDVRKEIENMSALPDTEIEEILDKINELEKIVKSPDRKSKKWENAKGIVKWIADKGVDVGIALLPLLLQIK